MKKLIVVNNPRDWTLDVPGVEVVASRQYLTDPGFAAQRNVRVFNLCRDYSYQSKGYYVSLLAEARGHKVIPSVRTIQDLKNPVVVRIESEELDDLIQKSLKHLRSDVFVLSIYFGKNVARQYDRLSRELYKLFQAPLLRARFTYHQGMKKWLLQSIRAIDQKDIPAHHLDFVREAARAYFARKRYDGARAPSYLYDLAILVNPDEPAPPSNARALQRFVEAAEALGFYVEFITREDYSRLAEFDALFIRETTSVNHHTYRFASRAQSEGMAVIDSPDAILRCNNKVYLAELFQTARLPVPETLVVHADNRKTVAGALGLPCVLKLPDSSFSRGVVKVKTPEELRTELDRMLEESELVIAQAFTPTDFDWRIGILDGRPLYACKYFMAKGHWQIYNWGGRKADVEGGAETVPVEQAPPAVVEAALRAVRLIGDGLFGVDVKEVDGRPLLIEVNENPNIDAGVEDAVLKDELYTRIIQALKTRIENRLGISRVNTSLLRPL
ncbi:MAG: ribosomal protein S6 modification protein [Rhodothermaceae bacterium]|nr:MAG: ribosomal protein S6 modification protein [Rhodothermaceae bacterium]